MNAAFQDLSLLTNITHEDIQQLQTVSKREQADRAQFILKDDGPLAWDLLNKARQGRSGVSRVDFILDNGECPRIYNVSIHRELPRSWIRGWLHILLESLKIKPPQLYTDLIFAEFLVTILGIDKVVFQYVQTTIA